MNKMRWLGALWLGFILVAATKRLIRVFPPAGTPLNNDAQWTYLPNAHKLLADPWGFLSTDPSSYHVAPLGYMWPALWGADPTRVQLANCILFLLCLLLLWRCATRLGGLWAGVVATALMAHHPVLAESIPQVLTESQYLFGLMLLLTGTIEHTLGAGRRRRWLAVAALGLTITLLSRPVLQFMALALLVLCATLAVYLRRAQPTAGVLRWRPIVSPAACIALCAALLLPLATIVKNGVYFDLWGLGTGAGSGLSYGVSPYKMGLEPVFSGFQYDASIIPKTVDPQTQGHPLDKRSDAILRQAAIALVKNTTLADNAAFFAHKLHAWLFYSTPELQVTYKLRAIRLFEWLAIATGIMVVLARCLVFHPPQRWPTGLNADAARLPGPAGQNRERLVLLALLLLAALGMALQLTPVLSNSRYNIFFMEPWLMLLAGVGMAIVLQRPAPACLPARSDTWARARAELRWLTPRALLVLLLFVVPTSLAKRAVRHETWSMDPYRPGPTAVVLERSAMGTAHMTAATAIGPAQWRVDSSPSRLLLPLTIATPQALSPQAMMDGIWRLRFAVVPPAATRACRQVDVSIAHSHPSLNAWFNPPARLHLQSDGQMHTYAIHGNGQLRPAGNTELALTFDCPPGTQVHWGGAELLRSTLPEAARDFVQQGTPINPYRRSEPLPPQNAP